MKVISFSLWGEKPLYVNGAVWNAQHKDEFYPDWVCRFYHDDTVSDKIIETLKDAGAQLVKMGKTSDVLGMFWRFNPMFDDNSISRFIVRDTDSKFTIREVKLVEEWISTTKPFHIIRDCESHETSILGGTWGAVPGCIPDFELKMGSHLTNIIPDRKNPRGIFHGSDQMFLNNYIWPLIRNNHCAHIRKGCPKLRYTQNDIEIDDPEDGHYVGMVA